MGWKKNILVFSLLTAIITLPLSLSVCHAALILYIIAWMCEGQWRLKSDLLMNNPLAWAYLIFFGLHIIGISYSEDISNGWFNIEKKIFFFILPVIFATTLSLDKPMIRFLFKGFIFTCIVTTLYCFAAAYFRLSTAQTQNNFDNATLSLFQQLNPDVGAFWMHFSYADLASGVGIHPTFLSLYLVFCILLIIHLYSMSFSAYSFLKKAGILFLCLYFETIIALLSSRILIFSLIAILIFGLFFLKGLTRLRPSYLLLITVLALTPMILILLINPVSKYRNLQEPIQVETYEPSPSGVFEYSTGIRKSLWMLSISSILNENPIIGAGTGDVKDVMKKNSLRINALNIMGSYDPHNQFMYTQIGLGFIGLTVLAVCFYFPAWMAYRQKHYLYISFMLVITLVCITESLLESQKGIVFFAIFNSLMVFPYYKLNMSFQKQIVYG